MTPVTKQNKIFFPFEDPEAQQFVDVKNVKMESEIHLPDEIQDEDTTTSEMIKDSNQEISDLNPGPDILEQAVSAIKGRKEIDSRIHI